MNLSTEVLDDSQLELIYKTICKVSPIPKEGWEKLPATFFKLHELKAGHFFVKEGKVASHFGLVLGGVLKEYYMTKKGDEYIKSFNFVGDFTGSYYDLLSSLPSTCSIRAIQNSILAIADFQGFYALFETNPYWQRLGRVIAETLFIKKAKREFELLTLSAEERYHNFLLARPNIEDELSQIHIASYLGITPVSLSRLKRKIKNNVKIET